MEITPTILHAQLRTAKEEQTRFTAMANAKAGEVQVLERLIALLAKPAAPAPAPAQNPSAP